MLCLYPSFMEKKLFCDVAILPQETEYIDLKGKTAVVIDILRATTTITVALGNGAEQIRPVAEVTQAEALKNQTPERLLCGERGGQKLSGFDMGNSPREYTREVVAGRELVLTTTNGTRAILAAAGADHVLMASFLNAPTVVQACKELAKDVVVVCAGTVNRFSLEDTVCAGLICDELAGRGEDGVVAQNQRPLSDGAVTALLLYRQWEGRILDMLNFSTHGQRLVKLGYGADLDVCSQIGTSHLLPVYADGMIQAQIPV